MSDGPCVCIAGWHFHPDVFEAVRDMRRAFGATVYVLSHRPLRDVPHGVVEAVGEDRVLARPNIGYDWGCYQQFFETGLWRAHRHVIFMHDDVVVRDTALVPATVARLERGARFVGNGPNAAKDDWPATHAHCYAHARVRPPGPAYRHSTVRGSFVAATREALGDLGGFEVFWDPFHVSDRYGNWSVVATGARMALRGGPGGLEFLSDTGLASDYLVELVRGDPGATGPPASASGAAAMAIAWQAAIAARYMRLYWSPGRGRMRVWGLRALGAVLAVQASRRQGAFC